MDNGWWWGRMPDAHAAHEGGDVLACLVKGAPSSERGGMAPLHAQIPGPFPIFRLLLPVTRPENLCVSVRAIAIAHRLLAHTVVEPGCGNETNPSTMANSASGMAVSDECKLKFQDLKSKRSFRFITFKIDEQTQQVVVDRLGQPGDTYDDFTASMPDNECRYAVYDFDFTTDENCQKSKIFFVSWSPDTSRVRSKMLYASSKDRFKRELDGIQVELQATDPSEMSMDIVKARAL
ncbi:unnamed protein product [Urochloa humidicola]